MTLVATSTYTESFKTTINIEEEVLPRREKQTNRTKNIKHADTVSDSQIFYPFTHQVGGQFPVLTNNSGEIAKPACPQEYKFYSTLKERHINYSFIPKFYRHCVIDISNIVPSCASPLRPRRRTCTVDLGILNNDKSISLLETDKNTQNLLWKKFKNGRLKKLQKDDDNLIHYVILEDLTFNYKYPCVLDVKMGLVQNSPNVTEAKIISQREKCLKSTSGYVGFRLCGLKVYNNEMKNYIIKDKYWGRDIKLSDLLENLKLYFFNGRNIRFKILKEIINRLIKIREEIKHTNWRYWSSSILLIYDGNEIEGSNINVKLIDYAHTEIEGYDDYDENILFGIDNLITYLKLLLPK